MGEEFFKNSEQPSALEVAENQLIAMLVKSPVVWDLHKNYNQWRADDYMDESPAQNLGDFVKKCVHTIGTVNDWGDILGKRINRVLESDLQIADEYVGNGVEFLNDQERLKEFPNLVAEIRKIKSSQK